MDAKSALQRQVYIFYWILLVPDSLRGRGADAGCECGVSAEAGYCSNDPEGCKQK